MAEEEEVNENKRVRPRERACAQQGPTINTYAILK